MQALGVVHALAPVLARCSDAHAAAARHTAAYNANLWMAPAILAAMARLESEGRGADAVRLREIAAPPLSGLGDAVVWKALRPACVFIAVAAVLLGGATAGIVAACVIYAACAVQQVHRAAEHGAALGGDLARHIDAVRPAARAGRVARRIAATGAGALYGYGIVRAWETAPSAAFLLSAALVLGYTAARRQLSPGLVLLVLVAASAVVRRVVAPVGAP
jgi:hypothetical protein